MSPLDVVYVVRGGEDNDELRHSLRSLVNLPIRQVWMVGYRPKWVADSVGYVPTVQRGQKNQNTAANWQAMAASSELPDQFVLMNDDFYVTRPAATIPRCHRGPLDEVIEQYGRGSGGIWRGRAVSTRALLRATLPDVELYGYELHLPATIDRAQLAESMAVLARTRRAPIEQYNKRTWHFNYAQVGGQRTSDVKAMGATCGMPDVDLPFVSTSPHSWTGLVGGTIRQMFPDLSPYERTPSGRLYQPAVTARRRLTRVTR
jgi:hypothetical protein